jgi:2-iminobutanoate/2-iminopropanoate deaminase
LVFVSGTAPHDPATGTIEGGTIQEQTRQCPVNISAILEEAGSSLDKIVSATDVLAEEEDFPGMDEEWLKWFPTNPPARQGAKLPLRFQGLRYPSPQLRKHDKICSHTIKKPNRYFESKGPYQRLPRGSY